LKDKGKKFTSKLIIISTNATLMHEHNFRAFIDSTAIKRRLGHVVKFFQREQSTYSVSKYLTSKVDELQCREFVKTTGSWVHSRMSIKEIVSAKVKEIISCLPVQIFPLDNEIISDCLVVPTEIPHDLNVVSAYAIPEPLKVRMITKPHPYCHVLKRLQKSLFEGLKDYPLFRPNFDPNYDANSIINSDKEVLSGDYSNATDGLNYYMSQAAMNVISQELLMVGEQFLSKVVEIEGGRHIIEYPKWTNIQPILQQNGQLMGSLLSFPILCWVNAFICLKATNRTLDTNEILIHGDDVVMTLDNREDYNNWVSLAEKVGFGLSPGKCYLSSDFCTFDSRLYLRGTTEASRVSGFKSTQGLHLSKISNLLDTQFPKGMIVKLNKSILKRTTRSIDRPSVLFGLQKFYKFTRFYETYHPTGLTSKVCQAQALMRLLPRKKSDHLWEVPTGKQHFCNGATCFDIDYDKILKELSYLKYRLSPVMSTTFAEYWNNVTIEAVDDEYGLSGERGVHRIRKQIQNLKFNFDVLGLNKKAKTSVFHCEGDIKKVFLSLLIAKVPRLYDELDPVLVRNDPVVSEP